MPSLILWIADIGLTLAKHTGGLNNPLRMRPVLSLLLAESLFILFVGPSNRWKDGGSRLYSIGNWERNNLTESSWVSCGLLKSKYVMSSTTPLVSMA